MQSRLTQRSGRGLEGLCEGPADRADVSIRIGRGSQGIERLEARLSGQAYAPHRHDTYAIGITLAGVQTFHYRGALRIGLPGQGHVLHPDELHDGGAGTAESFAYRIVAIDPALVQQALGGQALPFVADPVIAGEVLPPALWQLDEPIDEVAEVELVAAVADLLVRAARAGVPKRSPLRLASLWRVRDLILADPVARHPIGTLEAVAGLDRWTLALQFRLAFGTSPSGSRTMRQLDAARRLIRGGTSLAAAADAAGFADQSHLTRQFKRAYGLTPAKWATALV
jgi:AraC-like DNA-binding protein